MSNTGNARGVMSRVRKRAGPKFKFNILSTRCTWCLLPFSSSWKYPRKVCNTNLCLHVTEQMHVPIKSFGSIWPKIILGQHILISFHNRLKICEHNLHCFGRGDIAHNKELEYIRANRFLCLQISPNTWKIDFKVNNLKFFHIVFVHV